MPQEKEEGPLSKFYQVIQDSGSIGKDFLRAVNRGHVTLFAPSNEAWDDGNLKNLIGNAKLKDILEMHLIDDQKLSLNNIEENNRKNVIFFCFFSKYNFKFLTKYKLKELNIIIS